MNLVCYQDWLLPCVPCACMLSSRLLLRFNHQVFLVHRAGLQQSQQQHQLRLEKSSTRLLLLELSRQLKRASATVLVGDVQNLQVVFASLTP